MMCCDVLCYAFRCLSYRVVLFNAKSCVNLLTFLWLIKVIDWVEVKILCVYKFYYVLYLLKVIEITEALWY